MICLANDVLATSDPNYLKLPKYKQGSPGILTEGYVLGKLAEQIELIWAEEGRTACLSVAG